MLGSVSCVFVVRVFATLAHPAFAREDSVVGGADAAVGLAALARRATRMLSSVSGKGSMRIVRAAQLWQKGRVRPRISISFSWSRRFSWQIVQTAPRPTGATPPSACSSPSSARAAAR